MTLAPENAPSLLPLLPLQSQTSPLGQNQTPNPASWIEGDGDAWCHIPGIEGQESQPVLQEVGRDGEGARGS